MKLRALVLLVAMFASTLLVIVACSKSTSPNYGGNTGGGTGPTSFSFTFPATGSSHAVAFPTAGTIGYHCAPHQSLGMTGSVVVSAGAGADSDTVAVGVDAAGNAAYRFTPSTVTIKPGGSVRWINRSSMVNHTVTSN